MGIKLSLHNINEFLTVYSEVGDESRYEDFNKERSLENTVETLATLEKFYSSEEEKERIENLINQLSNEPFDDAVKLLRSEVPVFAILLMHNDSNFDDNKFLIDYFRSRNNKFPGMLTVLHENEISERIDNVHPWTGNLLNTLSSWPALFISSPKKKTLINLSRNHEDLYNQLIMINKILASGPSSLPDLARLSQYFHSNEPLDVVFHISDLHLGARGSSEQLYPFYERT